MRSAAASKAAGLMHVRRSRSRAAAAAPESALLVWSVKCQCRDASNRAVAGDEVGHVGCPPVDVPHGGERQAREEDLARDHVAVLGDPVGERLPHGSRVGLTEVEHRQRELDRVVRGESDLLAPVLVVEVVGEEVDERADEPAVVGVAVSGDRADRSAEGLGNLVGAKCHLCDDAEGAAASAPQRPEQVLVLGLVGNEDLAVGGDNFDLEHVAGRGPEPLREAAEAAALGKAAGGADRRAPTALHVAAAPGGGDVGLQPPGAGTHRDRGNPLP